MRAYPDRTWESPLLAGWGRGPFALLFKERNESESNHLRKRCLAGLGHALEDYADTLRNANHSAWLVAVGGSVLLCHAVNCGG